jgi:hypothetical protein
MTWFDINSALRRIRNFLSKWKTLISNLDKDVRPSSIFECFCYISLIEAYDSCGFQVDRRGPSQVFFKRSVLGDPNRYTYFVVSNPSGIFEVRQNQGYRNKDDIYFNLDISIIRGEGALEKSILKPQNIHTFLECKHYREFYPSTCANFIGLARMVMPLNILWRDVRTPNYHAYPPPALLVSGNASHDVLTMMRVTMQKRYHIRFFDNISPYSGTSILIDWLMRRI